jgi:electron transport complex protein RnfG
MSDTAAPLQEKIPGTPRLVGTLALAGLLSGLVIVTVFQVTLPLINANKAERLRRAVFEVLPGSERMGPLVWQNESLVAGTEGMEGPTVYGGYDATGNLVGYAIPNNGPGFQDNIALLYGFDPDARKVVGLAILESRETPGLGDKIYKDEAWMAAFRDLAVEPEILVTKDGAAGPHEVDAITGATISSKAVARIINTANQEWLPRLPTANEAPAAPAPADGEGE